MRQMIAVLALMATVGAGCQDQKLEESNRLLTAENAGLRTMVGQLQGRPDPAKVQGELAAREARIRELEDKLKAGQAPGLEGLDTSYDAQAGTLTVTLSSDILYASGRSVLQPSAVAALDKVVAALEKEYADKTIRVEGYTDTDPINRTKSKWMDNLDLSLNRAAAVTRYLEKNGIDPTRVTTSGFGENKPKATKAKSRRVEIVVVVRQ